MNKLRKRKFGIAASLLLSTSLFLQACSGEAVVEEAVSTDLLVSVVKPARETLVNSGEFIGRLSPEEQTAVVAKLSGEVTDTYFEVGDYVNRGDLLFTLDDTAAALQVQNAQAAYDMARAGADQQLGGLDIQMAQAQNSLESAVYGIQSAEHGIQSAENAIAQAESGIAQASDGYDRVKKEREELQDNLPKINDGKKQAEKAYEGLKSLDGTLTTLKDRINTFNQSKDVATKESIAAEIAGMLQTDIGSIGIGGSPDDIQSGDQIDSTVPTYQFENKYLAPQNLTLNGLSSALSSAKSAAESAANMSSQIGSTIATLENQETSLANSKTSAWHGYNQAVNGYDQAANGYNQAASGAVLAQKNYDYTVNYTVPSTKATVQSQLAQARVGLDSAKLQLDYTKVTAPVSGRIESINVSQYGMAQAGNPAYIITNEDNIIATFKVSEKVMQNLRLNQPVSAEKNGEIYPGYITEISSSVDLQSGLFEVKALIEGDKNNLYSGASIKLITDTERAEQALTLPVSAVYYEDAKPYIYCMEDGKAVKTFITTGISNGEAVAVDDGITDASQVIVSWSPQLRDGAVVYTEGGQESISGRDCLPSAGAGKMTAKDDSSSLAKREEPYHD